MPAAARVDDPITHTEAHSEGISEMIKGAVVGAVIGAALIAFTVATGGTGLILIGAAVAAGGTVLSMGGKGFLQGVKEGEKKVAKHGQVKTGSGNVTINKHAAAAACLSMIECDEHNGPQKLAQGSRTVTINGKMASRVGDRSVCDGVIAAGSGNVTIGGVTGQCAAINKEVADWEKGLAKVAIVVGTVAKIVGLVLSGVGIVNGIRAVSGLAQAILIARTGASLLAAFGLGYIGDSEGGKRFGEGTWQQEAIGTVSALVGGGLVSKVSGMFGGAPPEVVTPTDPVTTTEPVTTEPVTTEPVTSEETAPTNGASPRTGRYGDLKSQLPNDEQANHLNQNAAFKQDNAGNTFIPPNDGAAVGMRGNAFTEPGTPHYEFHRSLESFWDQYRPGGSLEGMRPSNAEYDQGLRNALRASSLDEQQVNSLADYANQNRLDYNLRPSDPVPRVPGILRQRPPTP